MSEKEFRTIRFIEKEVIESNVVSGKIKATDKARASIVSAPADSIMALRVSINSPLLIEDARVLSPRTLRELADTT